MHACMHACIHVYSTQWTRSARTLCAAGATPSKASRIDTRTRWRFSSRAGGIHPGGAPGRDGQAAEEDREGPDGLTRRSGGCLCALIDS